MTHDREPVSYTCPDIDRIIELLEELRTSNDKLRTWGQDEATRVDELEAELEELQEQVSDLTNQLQEAQEQLKALQ